MPGRRKQDRQKISWSRDMNIYLLECRDNAKLLNAGENCPRRNGRKVGYMELMRDMFLERFPQLNSLTAQNLRDQISQAEKSKQSLQIPLEETYRSDVNSLQHIPIDTDTDTDADCYRRCLAGYQRSIRCSVGRTRMQSMQQSERVIRRYQW